MKKKHPEHVNLERWLVSYADFITLLFAFFVIMYASAKKDTAKAAAVAESIRKAFGAGPVGMANLGGASGGATLKPFEAEEIPGGRINNLEAGKTNTSADPDPELQDIRELLEETIHFEMGATEIENQLQMQYDSRGLIVNITAKDFFDSGSVEVRPDIRPVLDQIGLILSRTKRLFRVEGHCDISEEKVPGFQSSWDFSAARARWVVEYWVKKYKIDKSRVGIVGYSHYRSLSHGTDPWSRAKNRRVEIIILNNTYNK